MIKKPDIDEITKLSDDKGRSMLQKKQHSKLLTQLPRIAKLSLRKLLKEQLDVNLSEKFFQSVKSLAVKDKFGNHFADYKHHPNLYLREAKKRAKETINLGLEITFCESKTEEVLTIKFITINNSFFRKLSAANLNDKN